MIFSTGTKLDSLLTVDGASLGGLVSPQILCIVQSGAEVGATTFCLTAAKANADIAGYIGIGSYVQDAGCVATVDLTGFGIYSIQAAVQTLLKGGLKLVIVDALQWANSNNISVELCGVVPELKQWCVEYDACLIVAANKYQYANKLGIKATAITGMAAFKHDADYIILLDKDEDAGYTASCIWSPAGCSFENEPWLIGT